jgi:hypothetical protein
MVFVITAHWLIALALGTVAAWFALGKIVAVGILGAWLVDPIGPVRWWWCTRHDEPCIPSTDLRVARLYETGEWVLPESE